MIEGIMKKYLHIDLSSRKFHFGTPPEGLFEEYIGGKGAGLKLLLDMGLVTHDPLEALRLGHQIHVVTGRPATIGPALVPPGRPPRNPGDPAIACLHAELLDRLLGDEDE